MEKVTINKTDMDINRFLVMCIKQYASATKESSKSIYNLLSKKGILQEIIDNYEDLHGMSIYSINEYISKRTGSKYNVDCPEPLPHDISKTIIAYQTIELIAENYKLSIQDARDKFYNSEVVDLLEDNETCLYGQSALYLLSLYEMKTGATHK